MPKHLIRRFAPDHRKIRSHRHLQLFGKLLHDQNLWHMNRRSVSGAFAVGLFWTFVPLPFQMVWAAATAILVRVNLPISVALVWITNPVTIPPIFYFTYRLGAWILGHPTMIHKFEPSLEWLMGELAIIWQPLFLGSLICALVAAILGFLIVRGFWRLHIINYLKQRQLRRLKAGALKFKRKKRAQLKRN